MKYIIMCGGKKPKISSPPGLRKVNGEVMVERTIRLLREFGIDDISISCNLDNDSFDYLKDDGIEIIKMVNNYSIVREPTGSTSWEKSKGYWVEAFYDTNEPTCYLCGDAWYSKAALKTIVETECKDFLMFGTRAPLPEYYGKKHDEPAGWKIVDWKKTRAGIKKFKEMQDKRQFGRYPMSWELYRIIDGLNPNVHKVGKRFVGIHDYIGDIDSDGNLNGIEKIIKENNVE